MAAPPQPTGMSPVIPVTTSLGARNSQGQLLSQSPVTMLSSCHALSTDPHSRAASVDCAENGGAQGVAPSPTSLASRGRDHTCATQPVSSCPAVHRQPSSIALPTPSSSRSSLSTASNAGYGSSGSSPTGTEITSTYASLADLLPNGASPEDRVSTTNVLLALPAGGLAWVAETVSRLLGSWAVARTHAPHHDPSSSSSSPTSHDLLTPHLAERVSPIFAQAPQGQEPHVSRRYSTATVTPNRVSSLPHLPVRAATYSRATGGTAAAGLANVFATPSPPLGPSPYVHEATPLLGNGGSITSAAGVTGDALGATASSVPRYDNAILVDIASIVAAQQLDQEQRLLSADKAWHDPTVPLSETRSIDRVRRAARKCVLVIGMLFAALFGLLVMTSLLVLLTSKIMRPTAPPVPSQPHCLAPSQTMQWPTELAITTANLRHLRVVLASGPAGTVHVERARDTHQVTLGATCPELPDSVPLAIKTAPAMLDAEMQRAGSHVVVRLSGAAVVVNTTAAAPDALEPSQASVQDDVEDDLGTCAVVACARPHWTLRVPDLRDVSLAIDEDRSALPGIPSEPILFAVRPATSAPRTVTATSSPFGYLPDRSIVVHKCPSLAELSVTTQGSISVRSPLERVAHASLRAGGDVAVAGIAPSAASVQISAFQGSVRIDRLSLVSCAPDSHPADTPATGPQGKRSVSAVAAMGSVHIEADVQGVSYGSSDASPPTAGRVVDMRLRAPRGVVDVVPLTDLAAKALGGVRVADQPLTEWSGRLNVDQDDKRQNEQVRMANMSDEAISRVDTKVDVVAMHGKVELWMA